MSAIAPEIFKAYDIRGIVDRTLTEEPRSESDARSRRSARRAAWGAS